MRFRKISALPVVVLLSLVLILSAGGGALRSQSREKPMGNNPLVWNTFCGSPTRIDDGWSLAADGDGNIYMAGRSEATWGTPRYAHSGGYDVVVIKFNRSGNRLWHTFLGCPQADWPWGLVLDSGGHIYVCGESEGSWGTPRNAFAGGTDAFVAKLDNNGVLQWNTFLGGPGVDKAYDIVCDENWNLFVCGKSALGWGNPIVAFSGETDAFAAKIDGNGLRIWHTFLGGENADTGWGITLDNSGDILIGGGSQGTWGTPVNPYAGGGDAFAARLDRSGHRLWNTFMGGATYDLVYEVVCDAAGNAYLSGYSFQQSWGAPIVPHSGGLEDGFAVKLDGAGNRLWHTFFGGPSRDFGEALTLDSAGFIYVAGCSAESWGTPRNPHAGGVYYDAVLVKYDANGHLLWNSFYGSTRDDEVFDIFVDGGGSIYLAGLSELNWGTPVNPNVGNDILVAKFSQIFDVAFSAWGGGSLIGAANQAVSFGGNCAPVTAVPSLYHVFLNWTGSGGFVTSTQNPLTVTNVTADMAIVAQMPAILPPIRQSCERVQNRSLRQIEYINVLRWSANPGNDALDVAAYRIYEITTGPPSLLAEVGPQTIEYWHRNAGTATRTYQIVAVVNGVEGEPLVVTL